MNQVVETAPEDTPDEVNVFPCDVPIGSFILDGSDGVWVEVTGKPVTVAEVTVIPVIDGFDVLVAFDANTPIQVCHGPTG